MNSKVVHIIVYIIVFNCAISAKDSDDEAAHSNDIHSSKVSSIIPDEFFAEGGNNVNAGRIKARKGAPDPLEGLNATSIDSTTANKNISSLTTLSSDNSTISLGTLAPSSSTTTTSTTTQKPSTTSSTTVKSTTTTLAVVTTKPTKKPIKKPVKPQITLSADDSQAILNNEKNINYNVSKIEDTVTVPRTSSDTDRSIIDEEKRTRRNYILYMGLVFAIPACLTLAHVSYRKIKNWMEIRHYQRVVST
jgi:hypothetical protein